MTNKNFALKYDRIPGGAMLPDMISDAEVRELMDAEDSAAARLQRRVDAQRNRQEGSTMTKFILGAAAVAAAVTLVGKEIVDYNRAHSDSPAITHVSPSNSGSASR